MISPPLHHKESPFFAADRGAYWRHLRGLGPVVKIDSRQTNAARLLSHQAGRRARGFARPGHVCVAAENLQDRTCSAYRFLRCRSLCGTRSEHARFGRVLHPLFSPKGLAPFAPVLRARAATLVDTVAATGQCDAINVADTYACQALLTVCGLPADDARAARLIRAAVIGDSNGAAELELFNVAEFRAGRRDAKSPAAARHSLAATGGTRRR